MERQIVKSCEECCFAHLCGDRGVCRYYCSTSSTCETDDEELIESGRDEFRKEWFSYIHFFYE